MKRILTACALLLGFTAAAQAQVDRATLSGTVRDTSGALIAGASVVVTNTATNLANQTKTNAEGNYTAVNLRPGRYLVEAEAAGFQKATPGHCPRDRPEGPRGLLPRSRGPWPRP